MREQVPRVKGCEDSESAQGQNKNVLWKVHFFLSSHRWLRTNLLLLAFNPRDIGTTVCTTRNRLGKGVPYLSIALLSTACIETKYLLPTRGHSTCYRLGFAGPGQIFRYIGTCTWLQEISKGNTSMKQLIFAYPSFERITLQFRHMNTRQHFLVYQQAWPCQIQRQTSSCSSTLHHRHVPPRVKRV